MALPQIPTPKEIKDRIVADLNNNLNQTTPDVAKAFNKVLAGALAGLIVLLYQAIIWVYAQIFPDTADEKALTLLGALVGVKRNPATFTILTADVTGTNGTTVPIGTQFRGPSSQVYKVTVSGVVVAGNAPVTIKAIESGEKGNLINGTEIDIISPIPGLVGTAVITATAVSGDDAESLDAYRTRVSAAYKKRRTGGSPADYEAWGLETPNFNWISPLDSITLPGDVLVYGKVDNQPDGIPTPNQLAELENYLKSSSPLPEGTGFRDRHPIGPPVTAMPITRFSLDVEIIIQDATPEIEADVEAAVISYLENQEPYNEAISISKKDTISEGGISNAANSVANPQGATITSVILKEAISGTVVPSYQLFGGEFGKVGTITFTEVI